MKQTSVRFAISGGVGKCRGNSDARRWWWIGVDWVYHRDVPFCWNKMRSLYCERTHTHINTPERQHTHTHTFTYLYAYGGKLLPGRSNNIGLFIYFFFSVAKQVDNLTLTRVLHRELLGKLFLAPGSLWLFTSQAKKNFVIIGTFST